MPEAGHLPGRLPTKLNIRPPPEVCPVEGTYEGDRSGSETLIATEVAEEVGADPTPVVNAPIIHVATVNRSSFISPVT